MDIIKSEALDTQVWLHTLLLRLRTDTNYREMSKITLAEVQMCVTKLESTNLG